MSSPVLNTIEFVVGIVLTDICDAELIVEVKENLDWWIARYSGPVTGRFLLHVLSKTSK